jgi:hypothetical protein
MRAPAPPAPRPARAQPHVTPLKDPHPARSRAPPPAQRTAARRARQLPARQLPFDHIPVTVYREHDASKRQPAGPPRGLAKDHGEGRARYDPLTVPAHAPNGNPQRPPRRIRNASDANPLPHRHLRHPGPAHTTPALRHRHGAAADENTARPPPAATSSAPPAPLRHPAIGILSAVQQ